MELSELYFPPLSTRVKEELAAVLRGFADYIDEDPCVVVEQTESGMVQLIYFERLEVAVENNPQNIRACMASRPLSVDFYFDAEKLAMALWEEELDYFTFEVLGMEGIRGGQEDRFLVEHEDEIRDRARAREWKVYEEAGLSCVILEAYDIKDGDFSR